MKLTYSVAFGETASGELGAVGIIQDKKTGKWLCWPDVEAASRDGQKVHIRPLTEREIIRADKRLERLYRREVAQLGNEKTEAERGPVLHGESRDQEGKPFVVQRMA